MTDEIERRLRRVENELAAMRGWREAINERDDKTVAWVPVVVAIVAVIVSAVLPLILGGAH